MMYLIFPLLIVLAGSTLKLITFWQLLLKYKQCVLPACSADSHCVETHYKMVSHISALRQACHWQVTQTVTSLETFWHTGHKMSIMVFMSIIHSFTMVNSTCNASSKRSLNWGMKVNDINRKAAVWNQSYHKEYQTEQGRTSPCS